MKRNKLLFIPLIGSLLIMPSCDKKDKPIDYIDNEDLLLHYDFNSTSNYKVTEKVSNIDSELSYNFKSPKYKQPSDVPCVRGVDGNAISFDGNSTSFEGPSINFGDGDFTISFYIAPRAYERNDGQYTSIITNLSGFSGIDVAMAQFGYWKVSVATDKGLFSALMASEDKIIPLYDWSYIAIRYSKDNSNVKIFLNGELVNTLSLRGGKIISSKYKLTVGKSISCMSESVYEMNHFNGLLDELKIYNGALSDKKIEEFSNKAKTTSRSEGIVFSYDTLADDRYATQYHMRNPLGWANEFYGGFKYNGKYHIFSQHNPFRPKYYNGQRWGHLVSDDLVHWKQLTPALTPSDNHIDNSQTFSGSCILDKDGKPMMFYTGVNEANEYFNSISYAKPKDLTDLSLTTWVKSNRKIVNQGSNSNQWEFRDPFLYEEDGEYFMLIGGNGAPSNANNSAVYCYKASDDTLTNWTYLGVTYSGDTSTYPELGTTYELPNLFKLTNKSKTITKYMLMVSPIYGTCNSVTYWLGTFNKQTGAFTPDDAKPNRFDLGPTSMVLAASGFYDTTKDRNVFTTMMRTGLSDQYAKDHGLNDAQTLWKEIYLDDNGKPIFKVIDEYSSLEDKSLISLEEANLSISQANTMLSTIHSDSYKLEVEFDLNGDTKAGVYVKHDESHGEQILSSYDVNSKIFYCDTSRSSLLLKNLPSGGGVQEVDGNLKFTIYVDRSMVETYLNDVNEIATLAWNKYQSANSIKLYSNSSKALIKKLKVTTLKCAYDVSKDAYWG